MVSALLQGLFKVYPKNSGVDTLNVCVSYFSLIPIFSVVLKICSDFSEYSFSVTDFWLLFLVFGHLKKIIKILKSGEQVVVFPEGSRTLDGDLQRGEAGVGLIAAKSRAIIQPVRIFGAFEALPRGSGRLRFHPVTIVVGDPITLTPEEKKAKGRDAYQTISDRIMAEIAKIKHPSEN